MNLTDPPSLGLIGSQFSKVQPLPSFTLCRQRLILSTPHGVLKKVQIWSKIFCLLPLFSYSMFGRTAPWICLRLHFKHKSVFFWFCLFFSFSFLHTYFSIYLFRRDITAIGLQKNFNQGFRYYWLRLRLNILTILLGVPIWNFHEVFVFGISKTKFFAPVLVRATGKNIYDYGLYRKKKKEIHVISRLFRYTCF